MPLRNLLDRPKGNCSGPKKQRPYLPEPAKRAIKEEQARLTRVANQRQAQAAKEARKRRPKKLTDAQKIRRMEREMIEAGVELKMMTGRTLHGYRDPNKPPRPSKPPKPEKTKRPAKESGSPLDRAVQWMGCENYAAYLKTEHWKGIKRSYRESWPGIACLACGASKVQLHHTTYARIGRERLKDLIPLCRGCHKAVHHHHRAHRISLNDWFRVIRELRGLSGSELEDRCRMYHQLPD